MSDETKTILNLIGGVWQPASDGAFAEDRNPANYSEVVARFSKSTAEDAQAAIQAARAAFPGWANTPPPSRGAILDRASQVIGARLEDMARALTREEGKTLAEARGEVTRARDIFRYFSGEGWRFGGVTLPSAVPGELLYTRKEPLGVVSIITPWNFPIAIPAWKIAPALAYGNTVVFKPAGDAPLIAYLLVEALVEAGLPAGVINFITGSGSVVGNEMVGSPLVNGVSFTGSTTVGAGVYQRAIPNRTRVQLEMGGKNPLIVLADADLDLAVRLSVMSGFGLTGQACTAASRVIVEESVAGAYVAALAEAARKLVVGDGLKDGVQMGPAVSKGQLETDNTYIAVGKAEGARLVAGGESDDSNGYFITPTVFDHVRSGMRIAQEEIFGPVISVIRVKDLDEAIAVANDVSFGLSAGVVTNDLHKAFTFANQVEAGVVKVNEPTSGLALNAPFGGFKGSSANTFKEQGQAAIDFYTRTKAIYVSHG